MRRPAKTRSSTVGHSKRMYFPTFRPLQARSRGTSHEYVPPISTRTDLLKLLCEAAELEHGIACSYLYAGFSLKRDISEGGMTWEEQQKVRRWAAQIYFVASQEMLHLALVWNMTTAIGGTRYYFRRNFPQNSKYYPFHAPLELELFGPSSLKRFILYERPETRTFIRRRCWL